MSVEEGISTEEETNGKVGTQTITNDMLLCKGWNAKIVGYFEYSPEINQTFTESGSYDNMFKLCTDNSDCCSGWCANDTTGSPVFCCPKDYCSNGTACVYSGRISGELLGFSYY